MCADISALFAVFLLYYVTQTVMLARKWLNANDNCYLTVTNWLSHMLFWLYFSPECDVRGKMAAVRTW